MEKIVDNGSEKEINITFGHAQVEERYRKDSTLMIDYIRINDIYYRCHSYSSNPIKYESLVVPSKRISKFKSIEKEVLEQDLLFDDIEKLDGYLIDIASYSNFNIFLYVIENCDEIKKERISKYFKSLYVQTLSSYKEKQLNLYYHLFEYLIDKEIYTKGELFSLMEKYNSPQKYKFMKKALVPFSRKKKIEKILNENN